jgi:uncharacterized membrane protein
MDGERRLRDLERRVEALERMLQPGAGAQGPHEADGPSSASTHFRPVAGPSSPANSNPQREPPKASFDIERILGARWLARAGVLVLALGVVFFLKLAYDREWVPLVGRFAIAFLGGLGLFALGDVLRTRRIDPHFAQIIAGGGAVISYVTVYMAWVWTDYREALHLNLTLEIALLALVSGALGAYAIWRNLPVMAGVAVGLAALLVAPAGDFSSVGLLFVSLLAFVMLAGATWRRWQSLPLLVVIGVNIAHLFASGERTIPWHLVVASAVVVNVLAHVALHRLNAQAALRHSSSGLSQGLLVLVLGFSLQRGNVGDPLAWSLLGVGAAAVVGVAASRPLAITLAAGGSILLLLWPLVHFSAELWQTVAYLGMGVLALAATTWGGRWARGHAMACAALGTLSLFWLAEFESAVAQQPWFSAALALGIFLLGAALWWKGKGMAFEGDDTAGLIVMAAILLAWPFQQFPNSLWSTAMLSVAAVALAVAGASWIAQRRTVHALALGACAAATLSLLYLAIVHHKVAAHPLGSGALALAVLAAASGVWWSARGEETPERILGVLVGISAPLVYLGYRLDGWQIAVAWALMGLALAGAGMALRDRDLRVASFGVFALVLGRIFLIDFQNLDLPLRVLTFIVTGALLLAAAYLFARVRKEPAA